MINFKGKDEPTFLDSLQQQKIDIGFIDILDGKLILFQL